MPEKNDFEQLYYDAIYKIKQLELAIKNLTDTLEIQNTINSTINNKALKKALISEIIGHRKKQEVKQDFK